MKCGSKAFTMGGTEDTQSVGKNGVEKVFHATDSVSQLTSSSPWMYRIYGRQPMKCCATEKVNAERNIVLTAFGQKANL